VLDMADLEMGDVLGQGMTGTVYEALCVSLPLLLSHCRIRRWARAGL
jgi:hypothetical protein